jgi:hypothetical protein
MPARLRTIEQDKGVHGANCFNGAATHRTIGTTPDPGGWSFTVCCLPGTQADRACREITPARRADEGSMGGLNPFAAALFHRQTRYQRLVVGVWDRASPEARSQRSRTVPVDQGMPLLDPPDARAGTPEE